MNGSLTVITGCMFSGKTTELLRLLKRHTIARQFVQLFKPDTDTRYGRNKVVTHDRTWLKATVVSAKDPIHILDLIAIATTVVGIDEAQFFDLSIAMVCERMLSKEIDVIVAGLKQDSDGRLFGSMDKLLVMANFITNLTAVCVECGEEATMTQWRGNAKTEQVVIGGSDEYTAVCHKHYRRT